MAITRPDIDALADRGPMGRWRTEIAKPDVEKGDQAPQTADMSDVTRHEMNAALAASEARVASAISEMRTENAKFLGEFAAARADMAEFRFQVKESLGQMSVALTTQSKEVESKISGLKVWVLGGALSGAIAILLLFARENLASRAHQAPPTPPTPTEQTVTPAPKPQQAQPAPPATAPPAEPAKQP